MRQWEEEKRKASDEDGVMRRELGVKYPELSPMMDVRTYTQTQTRAHICRQRKAGLHARTDTLIIDTYLLIPPLFLVLSLQALKKNLKRVADACARAMVLPVKIQHPYTYSKGTPCEPYNVVENVLKDDDSVRCCLCCLFVSTWF